jgi:uncharacterized membrane protein YfcA
MAAFLWVTIGVTILSWQIATRDAITIPTPEWYPWFELMNWATAAALLLSVLAIASAVSIWFRDELRWITKVKFTLVGLACAFLGWFAMHWHVIGPAHRI